MVCGGEGHCRPAGADRRRDDYRQRRRGGAHGRNAAVGVDDDRRRGRAGLRRPPEVRRDAQRLRPKRGLSGEHPGLSGDGSRPDELSRRRVLHLQRRPRALRARGPEPSVQAGGLFQRRVDHGRAARRADGGGLRGHQRLLEQSGNPVPRRGQGRGGALAGEAAGRGAGGNSDPGRQHQRPAHASGLGLAGGDGKRRGRIKARRAADRAGLRR